jgi:hypothetical protein
VQAVVESLEDLYRIQRGEIPAEQFRRIEVPTPSWIPGQLICRCRADWCISSVCYREAAPRNESKKHPHADQALSEARIRL